MQPWEKKFSFFFSAVLLQGCFSVWFKPVCVSRFLIFWQDQAGLQLLTVHPSDTAPKSLQFCLEENKVFPSCVLYRWNFPGWKSSKMLPSTHCKCSGASFASSRCCACPNSCPQCCVHGSPCACLGSAGAQKGLLILPASVAKTPVAPSSSIEMSQ